MSSATLFNTERTENTEGHRKHYGSDSGFHRTTRVSGSHRLRAQALEINAHTFRQHQKRDAGWLFARLDWFGRFSQAAIESDPRRLQEP
jgi:hypothetical protein